MRRVKSALDTSIRKREVRSYFAGSARGHPIGRGGIGTSSQRMRMIRFSKKGRMMPFPGGRSLPARGAEYRTNTLDNSPMMSEELLQDTISLMSDPARRQFLALSADKQEEVIMRSWAHVKRQARDGKANSSSEADFEDAYEISEYQPDYGGDAGWMGGADLLESPAHFSSLNIRKDRQRDKRYRGFRESKRSGNRKVSPISYKGKYSVVTAGSGPAGSKSSISIKNPSQRYRLEDTRRENQRSFLKAYAMEITKITARQIAPVDNRGNDKRLDTIKAMEEKQARESLDIIKGASKKTAAFIRNLSRALISAANKGWIYVSLVMLPVLFLVMITPILLSSLTTTMDEDEAVASITATELVNYAAEWIGITKYVWGAGRAYETDWQDYTDCSGFVHGVFSHFGYEIGGTTVFMEGSGRLIGTNTLKGALPGDIILFFTGGILPGHSTHVGIYAGNGNMIHCTGSRANTSPENAGEGVKISPVTNDPRGYQVRRIIEGVESLGSTGTGGHRVDPTKYSTADIQLIWAIVAQEDNGSYEGALAVISSAMNRTESPTWSYLGNTAMKQLCAPGQYCYSMDNFWRPRLGGNVPEYVKQAVNDCLKKGIRNHRFTSFRSTKGKTTGPNAVQIGGNWFFGN